MSVDPITMQRMLQMIPEVNKRRKQAEMLRAAQGQFQQISQTPGPGNYTRQQQGAWFPTVQKYHRDYGAIGNQVAGALGSYLSGRQASEAEEELANVVGDQSVQAAHQIGGGGEQPTAQALRAYLGAIGGKDATAMMGTAPRVQSTKVLDDGRIVAIMSDSSTRDTGMTADYNAGTMTTADGRVLSIGKSGAGRGIAQQVNEIVQQEMQQIIPEGGAPFVTEANRPQNQTEALIAQQLGLPPDAPAPGYTTAPAAPAQMEQPVRVPTKQEEAIAAAAGKAQGEAANAPLIAQTAGAVDLAKEQAKNTADAQANLGSVENITNSMEKAVDELMATPGLDNIVGGSVWSRVPDKVASMGIGFLQAGTDTADAYAKYENLQGANFLQAFQSLKGGGQITEKEGQKAEQAFARLNRAQSKPEYMAALSDLKALAIEIRTRMQNKARGGTSAPAAPARPALPAGFQWED